MRHLLCFLLLAMTGCASLRDATSSSLTRDEMVMVVARARTMALGSGLLQESERAVVESRDPKVAYYFMAGVHCAQYFITWQFSDHQGVTVYGQGDVLSLEHAKVKRLPNKALHATAAASGS